ncbi:zinc finger protein 703-like [Brachionichthys hirsutus]|uniref:zinc finger protein 703-like n=1 Tax=Brachionichthys hirsutus TaxID=412623 RepID=UPI003604DCC3
MKYLPAAHRPSTRIELSETSPSGPGAADPPLTPLDPHRQAKRLPIRLINMLTAHTGHLLHPEYLQPLTSAPVSIELDAKKSPLALLAQTCSQIGKPDPPSSSKLGSSCNHGDKESSGRPCLSSLKHGEHRPSLEDKCSFKPYNKGSGDGHRDGVSSSSNGSDKVGFRVPGNNGNGNSSSGQLSYPPHAASPGSRTSSSASPGRSQQQQPPHKRSQSPGEKPAPQSQNTSGESASERGSPAITSSNSHHPKKDADVNKNNSDSPHSHIRAGSNGSAEGGAGHEAVKAESAQPNLRPGRITPISPYKTSQPLFPLPPSNMGYHGSLLGAYAGYPSQFVPGLDPTKSGLGVGGMGVGGKHPSSSPLTGASPPSFMQGLCRDPYCLSYPSVPHLGGSNCNSCIHDPSSTLKSSYPLVYPSHPLHSLHQSPLSSSASSPIYTYGFMLPNDPLPHACNWVSAAGPCDKRFGNSEELLAHLRTHTALPVGMDSKLLSVSSSGPAPCHLHLPHQSSPGSMPGSLSLRAPPGLGLSRYHPYSKVHLPPGPSPISLHSLPTTGPYYPHYALYGQRLGSSALGYQ